MPVAWKHCVLGVVAVSLLGAPQPARAQSTQIKAGNSLTFDGLTYTITSCSYVVLGASATCGPTGTNPLNGLLEAVSTNGGANLELLSAGSGPLISLTAPASPTSNSYDDLTLGIAVSLAKTPSKTSITSLRTTVAGSTTGASSELSKITVGTKVTTPAVNLSTYVGGAPSAQSFAATQSLNVSYDLHVSATSGTSPGNVLSLANVTLIYSPAPEPASISIFAIGLGGIAAARRRFRRRAAAIN